MSKMAELSAEREQAESWDIRVEIPSCQCPYRGADAGCNDPLWPMLKCSKEKCPNKVPVRF
jgi:hypothetical protein